jgi:hypothetical protein
MTGKKPGLVMDSAMMVPGVFILTVMNLIMTAVIAAICRPVKTKEW